MANASNIFRLIAILLALGSSACTTTSSPQGRGAAYALDSRNVNVKDSYNLCWRTGFWSPALAIADCDPDFAPRPVASPAPAPLAQAAPAAPPAAPPAAAPAPIAPAPVKPAPPPAPKRCDASITFQNEELFAFDRATLTPAARARLDRDVLDRLAQCANVEAVIVTGHTDRLGSQQYNQKLSERRADAVKSYLSSKGVPADKLDTLGMGKTAPAKFCPDQGDRKALIACLAPNRRVAVDIKGPAK